MGILGPRTKEFDQLKELPSAPEDDDIGKLVKHIKQGNVIAFNKEVKELYAKKVDLNTPTAGGWTCLDYAAYMGNAHIVGELINT